MSKETLSFVTPPPKNYKISSAFSYNLKLALTVADPAAGDFTEQIAGEDFCQRFKATLSPKDMAILELRVEGYGYQEIADKLGYKTHSAVVKRMEAIKRRFIQYEEEAGR